jgi:hypothetical protein
MHGGVVLALGLAAACGSSASAQELEPFALQTLPGVGRAVAAEIADLDGDARGDVLALAVLGMPPDETREVRVYFQDHAGALPSEPSWRAPLPGGAAAYDVAELDDRPGAELVLLREAGLSLLSLAGRAPQWRTLDAPVVVAAPAADERGLDRLRLVRPELGAARLLVPGLGTAAVLDARGEARSVLRIGARANYFLPPRPGPLVGENEMEIYLDLPRLNVADVDGDGRADVVTGNRHEVRVFRQREGGRFEGEPDRVLPLRLLALDDHVRNTGGARVDTRDWNGDGRADLLVAHTSGGLLRTVTRTRLHLNRGGTWNLAEPDQVFENHGGLAFDELLDLDRDGRPELVRLFTPLGLVDVAEILLQRALDVDAAVHRADAEGRFEEKPWATRRFDLALNVETLRLRGFAPTAAADWNGDGHGDLIGSGNGDAIEVWLGGPVYRFAERQAHQPVDTGGRMRFGSLDADGLPDWVIYDARRPDVPLRVGWNRGNLPGTPPAIRAAGSDSRRSDGRG